MAIAATMSLANDNNNNDNCNTTTTTKDDDDHEYDMVMPGFRFHPTEEELVEFYLRRKVEGKRFNVELITFLDLYRYDPWELPALAAIGEKEWFFYVPRDRKYRNGDRPNRVTTSGYWKATGADRMIRGENLRSIGLKKTLVFYSGKAPKGIRTSWIMNEYRLPQHETERYQKAEMSLCRVYKRPGVEDHSSLPRSLPSKASSSRTFNTQSDNKKPSLERLVQPSNTFGGLQPQQMELDKMAETTTDGSSSCSDVTTALALSKGTNNAYNAVPPPQIPIEDEVFLNQSKQVVVNPLVPNCTNFFSGSSNSLQVDDLQRLINFQQACISQHQQQFYGQQPQQQNSQFSTVTPVVQQHLNMLPVTSSLPNTFSDRLWEWNPMPEPNNRDYNNNPFK